MQIFPKKNSVSKTQPSENQTNNLEKKDSKNHNFNSTEISNKSLNSDLVDKIVHEKSEVNNIKETPHSRKSMTLRRSYSMVVSGFEYVAKKHQITSEAAEQLGKTISIRIKELNDQSLAKIRELTEYKNFDLENIYELGEEISDLIQDPDEYLKGFALLKNPKFAELMESTESAHRSFADSMKDNGEEKLLFGMIKTIKDFGGLVGLQDSIQVNQKNSSINIKA